jgi:hypothetical protein
MLDRKRSDLEGVRSHFTNKLHAPPDASWSAAVSVTILTVTRSIAEAISAGIAALARMQGAGWSLGACRKGLKFEDVFLA